MRKQTMTLDDVKRALENQNERLRDVFAAVEAGRPTPVQMAKLHALAELCTPARTCEVDTKWTAVRC